MTSKFKLIERVLVDRYFTEPQIKKIVPRLHSNFFKQPECLGEIVDTWNHLMSQAKPLLHANDVQSYIPKTAAPPRNSIIGKLQINMNSILADVEPDLLLLDPKKLIARHENILGLNLTKSMSEQWLILFNAPRGFYLQDWTELTKKIYYIEHYIMDLLYEKKEMKSFDIHPIIKSAAVTEADFDHIRTRYLFALRTGYKALSHMFSVRTSLERPDLGNIILVDDTTYLKDFAPFCSHEEYSSFADLIKNFAIDEDDAEIFERLAEVNALNYRN